MRYLAEKGNTNGLIIATLFVSCNKLYRRAFCSVSIFYYMSRILKIFNARVILTFVERDL